MVNSKMDLKTPSRDGESRSILGRMARNGISILRYLVPACLVIAIPLLILNFKIHELTKSQLLDPKQMSDRMPGSRRHLTATTKQNSVAQESEAPGSNLWELRKLSLQLQLDPRPQPVLEGEIRDRARTLSRGDLARLAEQALDESANGNARNAALYILIEAGEGAMDPLADIAADPVQVSIDASRDQGMVGLRQRFEVALRVKALGALDVIAGDSQRNTKRNIGAAVTKRLERISDIQTHPVLRFLTQISLSGLREGRPGKLNRFIDHTFDEGASK